MNDNSKRVLVTGGAGFVGCNLVSHLAQTGARVTIYDNLSRAGTRQNLNWLRATHPGQIEFIEADVTDRRMLRAAVEPALAVFHFAAQVAVTISLDRPLADFDSNARGTVEVLEAVRGCGRQIPVFFTSTNKVYGCLDDLELQERMERWTPVDGDIAAHGINESRPLDFRSPYGCSKGAADQYVLDYARTFAIPAVVFRMSCIYGPHQRGNEDQGWVAHFIARALEHRQITIYGDGKQVRDILYVDDLVAALMAAWKQLPRVSGRAFNVGGGPGSTLSLLELVDAIVDRTGKKPRLAFRGWRPGDQRYYVSDTRALESAIPWKPRVAPRIGIDNLFEWIRHELRATHARASVHRREPSNSTSDARHA
jgi:CDP-paratose 2-epimerase